MCASSGITFIDAIQSEDASRYGGKAYNLSRLHRLGIRVPMGFCIDCSHFTSLLESSPRLKDLVDSLAESDDPDRILSSASELETTVTSYSLPTHLVDAVTSALVELERRLGRSGVCYAVRSSATIEDATSHSFAGQGRTYLGVREPKDVLDSIKGVWQSLFSPNSVLYLKTMGVQLSCAKMGVIVQEMADADVSGVMFTANVANQNMDQMLIESTWGLGEQLVSGRVVPDTFVLDRRTGDIASRKLGTKETVSSCPAGTVSGVTTKSTSPKMRSRYTLGKRGLRALAELGLEVERGLGAPQDIEWCMKDDEITVLQSRPITTMKRC